MRLTIDDCWSAAEIPIHRGLVTIVSKIKEKTGKMHKVEELRN